MTYQIPAAFPRFRGRVWLICLIALGALLNGLADSSPEETERPYFSIPRGKACKTLNLVAQQAKVNLIVMRSKTRGITTQPINGYFEVEEAFRRLLEGTPLKVAHGKRSGAYTVVFRSSTPSVSASSNKKPNDTETKMRELRSLLDKLATASTAAAIASAAQIASGQSEDENDIFELSPFAVEANADSYSATSTLAGTRIKTDVSDIGSSISIYTERFLEDVAATDAGSLLTYSANVEVGGVLGNFANARQTNREAFLDSNSTKANPQQATRVRGLVEAQLTRNYFRTNVPFDSYNTSSVTINRGPNSVLFGLGSPGGVIENSIRTPIQNRDFGEVQLRFDHRGGTRAAVDYNHSLIDGRLAVRLNLLDEKKDFRQEPAFEDDERAFAAFDWVVLENEDSDFLGRTVLRGSYEYGEMGGNPPDVLPPNDGFSDWWTGIDAERITAQVPGFDADGLLSTRNGFRRTPVEFGGGWTPKGTIDGMGNNNPPDIFTIPRSFSNFDLLHFDATLGRPNGPMGFEGWRPRLIFQGRGRFDYRVSLDMESELNGFTAPSIMDRNVFDFVNHKLSGDAEFVYRDFDIGQVALEQQFLNGNLGFELAYNTEEVNRNQVLPFGGQGSMVYIDLSEHMPIPENHPTTELQPQLAPNPNVGRPVMLATSRNEQFFDEELETKRATAFAKFDFRNVNESLGKWLGSHNLTGLYEEVTEDGSFREFSTRPIPSNPIVQSRLPSNLRSGQYALRHWAWIGPSVLDLDNPSQVRITDTFEGRLQSEGFTYQGTFWDNTEKIVIDSEFTLRDLFVNADRSRDIVTTDAAVLQSHWLDDHLVTLVARRNDEIENFEETTAEPQFLENGLINPAWTTLGSETVFQQEGTTDTVSVVAKFPEKYLFELPGNTDLQLHYFESESFEPSGVRRNIFGELLQSPSGDTEEYGFTIDLLDNKLSIRATWYETSSSGASTGLGGAVGQGANMPAFWLSNWKDAELQLTGDLAVDFPWATDRWDSYQDVYDSIISIWPEPTRSLLNARFPNPDSDVVDVDPIQGLTSTFDFVSEGMEIELTGAITDNWNIHFNVAQQETVRSNTGGNFPQWAEQARQNIIDEGIAGLWQGNPIAFEPFEGQALQFWDSRVTFPLNSEKARDGTKSVEQREWRWNLVSTYNFTDGKLKGFGIGGGARWEDEVGIGYPLTLTDEGAQIQDVANPFFGDSEFYADAWLSYKTRLRDAIDWKVQLNVRNLVGGGADDVVPIRINPLGDITNIRVGPERQFILTNTFSF